MKELQNAIEITANGLAGPILGSFLKRLLLDYEGLLKIQRTLTLTKHFSIIWLEFWDQLAQICYFLPMCSASNGRTGSLFCRNQE